MGKMLLTATFLAVILHVSFAGKSSLSRVYKYPEQKIYLDYRESGDTKLVYARCNSSLPESTKQCIVTIKLDAFEKTPGETKECPVILKNELPNGVLHSYLWVHAFGNDKVLLHWRELQNSTKENNKRTIIKTTVVHMLDNCRTYETKVHKFVEKPRPSDVYLVKHTTYQIVFDDGFEIITGGMRDNCTKLPPELCELYYLLYKFDDQGRRIGEVEDWSKSTFNIPQDPSFIDSVKIQQARRTYFLMTRNNESLLSELMHRESNGYKRLLLRRNSCGDASRMMFHWSLVNEAIGFCYLCANSRFGCWQKGRVHLETQFTLSYPYTTDIFAVSNLQNDGLLLAAIKAPSADFNFSGIRSIYYDNFFLMEVDVKGNVKSIEVDFKTKCYYKQNYASVRLFQNKLGQYCIARLCESKYDEPTKLTKGRIETLVRCYSSDEFSKCDDSKCL